MGPHGPDWNASGVPLARTERDLARLVARPLVTADHHPDPARNPLSLSNECHPADRPPRNTPLVSHYVVTAPPSRLPSRRVVVNAAGRFRGRRGPASARPGAVGPAEGNTLVPSRPNGRSVLMGAAGLRGVTSGIVRMAAFGFVSRRYRRGT